MSSKLDSNLNNIMRGKRRGREEAKKGEGKARQAKRKDKKGRKKKEVLGRHTTDSY